MQKAITQTLHEYRDLPGPIWALAGAGVVNAVGMYVFPFLTLLLTDRLGYDSEEAGRILMLASTLFVPGSLLGGVIADKLGRKRLLLGAQLLAAICIGVIGFMPLDRNILWFILAERFFSGLMMPAFSAITYDLTSPSNRKTAFSLVYLSYNVGLAVGPLLAGYLYESHTRWLFLGDAGTTLISMVFIVAFLPETLPSKAPASHREDESGEPESLPDGEAPARGFTLKLLLQRPILFIFVLLMIIPWFVYTQSTFTLPLFTKALFPETGAFLYGKVMSLNAILVVFLTVPFIRITRNLRPLTNVILHTLLYAAGFGLMSFFGQTWAIYLATFIWTSGEILGATNIEVFVANHTPVTHRGRFTSVIPLISGTGTALAPWLMGIYLVGRPIQDAWSLCLWLGLIAAAGFAVLRVFDRKKTK